VGPTLGAGRADAWDKVTGRAVYAGDVRLPGMLYAALVRSPHPHARILRVVTDAAWSVPGVCAVLTGADVPYGTYGRRVRDMPVLAREVVRFAGERVAAVAAHTLQAAREAARRVEVHYEPLPAVLSPEEALRPDAPRVHEAPWRYPGAVVGPEDPPNLQSRRVWQHGEDVDAVLSRCPYVFDETYTIPAAHQGYLEPHACVAWWKPDGSVEVWASNKSPHRLRAQLAACLGVPADRIRVLPVYVGGDFGGKGSPMDVPVCVALSQATGRPVKLVLDYEEDLTAANPRHSAVVRVRLGVDRDGRMQALDVRARVDGGAYAAFKPVEHVNLNGFAEAGNTYRIGAVRIESLIAYTNTVPRGHMRSPGSLEANFAVESTVDMAARALGLDPLEFRLRNVLRTGDRGTLGEPWVEVRGEEVARAALAALREGEALREGPAPDGGRWARGVGFAFYCRAAHGGETEVELRPQPDGSVVVRVPFPDQGGGQHTVVRNVVLRELALPAEAVWVQQADTGELATDSGVGGSRVSLTASAAVAQVCAQLRDRLRQEGLEGWELRAALAELARRRPGESVRVRLKVDEELWMNSFCVQAARVRVDRDTGEVRVDELVTALDVAEVLNPPSHRAQVEGGVVMGLGSALCEEVVMEEGRVVSGNLHEYRLPSVNALPRLRVVLVPGGRGWGPYGVKPVGEMTNVAVAAAVANAVADAVGVRIRRLPISAEAVYRAMQEAGR
jgi:CO/xanthine dehydrogenase Mo-binding subunit